MSPVIAVACILFGTSFSSQVKDRNAERGYPDFGLVVGEAGDVDGDHVPDVVLGDPDPEGDTVLARFWIVSGSTGSVLTTVALPNLAPVDPKQQGCGFRVHGGADVDKDGVRDLLIAATPFRDMNLGWIFLVCGRTGAVLRRIDAGRSRSLTGEWARFVEDFDRDGVPDVGVLEIDPSKDVSTLVVRSSSSGDPIWGCVLSNACRSDVGGWMPISSESGGCPFDFVVVHGGASRCPAVVRRYSGSTMRPVWEHPVSSDRGGDPYGALALWYDVDGDGERDVVVSTCDDVHVLSGKDGTLLLHFSPENPSGFEMGFGWSLAVVRDAAPDAIPGLAIAETETDIFSGSVRLEHPKRKGWLYKPGIADDVHHLGYQMSSVGDVNSDGVDDLIVGSWEGAAGEPGIAQLVSGKDGSLLFGYRRKGNGVVATRTASSPAERRDK